MIPEIEMPGHGYQLNHVYPELFSDQISEEDKAEIESRKTDVSGWWVAAICAGSEPCFENLKKMIDEVIELFPDSMYIHVGGDEAAIALWNYCPVCRAYMKKHGLKSEKELYCEFVARITDYVLSRGRKPIVWEGFPKEAAERILKEVVVIAWEGYYQMADELVECGFDIINCSTKPLYVCPDVLETWSALDIMRWDVYNWQYKAKWSDAMLNPLHLAPHREGAWSAALCLEGAI